MQIKPRAIDLFCGIGGLSVGLERAGFEIIGGVDIWDEAAATYEHNHGCRAMVADLRSVPADEVLAFFKVGADDIGLVAGGPPCQGFSTVGRRDATDPRNVLWEHYYEFVDSVRPPYVLLENVEGMALAAGGQFVRNLRAALAEIGYRTHACIITSADYGVPQLRKRLIVRGWIDGLNPPEVGVSPCDRWTTVDEAIGDLPPLGPAESASEYSKPPTSEYQAARRQGATRLTNHEAANHDPDLVHKISFIPDGGNRKDIPDHLQPRSGFHNSYSRLASFRPAVAVTSNMRKPSSARAIHPFQDRGLTVREGLRLQSFDDTFVVLGSRTSQYLQVGNAVPPMLAEALGKGIHKAITSNDPARTKELRGQSRIAPVVSEPQMTLAFV